MKAISVSRKVRVDGIWRMLPVARNKNGFDWSTRLLQGNLITTLPGTFYLDWREEGKRVRRAVGDHPRDAKAALATQRQVLGLREECMEVEDAPQIRPLEDGIGNKIADVVSDFRKHPSLTLRTKSYAKYRNGLISFGDWTKKTPLNSLDRDDIKRFMSYLSIGRHLGGNLHVAVALGERTATRARTSLRIRVTGNGLSKGR